MASASLDKTIKLWNVESGECLLTIEGHDTYVRSVCYKYDSDILASGSYDESVKIWDTTNGKCLKTLEHHTSYV